MKKIISLGLAMFLCLGVLAAAFAYVEAPSRAFVIETYSIQENLCLVEVVSCEPIDIPDAFNPRKITYKVKEDIYKTGIDKQFFCIKNGDYTIGQEFIVGLRPWSDPVYKPLPDLGYDRGKYALTFEFAEVYDNGRVMGAVSDGNDMGSYEDVKAEIIKKHDEWLNTPTTWEGKLIYGDIVSKTSKVYRVNGSNTVAVLSLQKGDAVLRVGKEVKTIKKVRYVPVLINLNVGEIAYIMESHLAGMGKDTTKNLLPNGAQLASTGKSTYVYTIKDGKFVKMASNGVNVVLRKGVIFAQTGQDGKYLKVKIGNGTGYISKDTVLEEVFIVEKE